MQAIFTATLSAAALGGTVALSSLYYYARLAQKETQNALASARRRPVRGSARMERRAAQALDRRDPDAYYASANAELERKRAALERASRRNAEAAKALAKALDAAAASVSAKQAPPAAFENAKPFELNAFD